MFYCNIIIVFFSVFIVDGLFYQFEVVPWNTRVNGSYITNHFVYKSDVKCSVCSWFLRQPRVHTASYKQTYISDGNELMLNNATLAKYTYWNNNTNKLFDLVLAIPPNRKLFYKHVARVYNMHTYIMQLYVVNFSYGS